MQLTKSIKSILSSYLPILFHGGSSLDRITYTSRFWMAYLSSRIAGSINSEESYSFSLWMLNKKKWSGELVSIRTNSGLNLVIDNLSAMMIFKEIYQDNIYCECDMDDFKPRKGNVIFDIGAHQGIYSTWAAARVGDHGTVICVEPEVRNHSLLLSNIRRNKLYNTIAINAAISDMPGSVYLNICPQNSGGHSILDGVDKDGKIKVKCMNLNNLSEICLRSPDIIKIDAEGSAIKILRGGIDVIAKHLPKIVLEIDSQVCEKMVRWMLNPIGYKVCRHGNNLFASVNGR